MANDAPAAPEPRGSADGARRGSEDLAEAELGYQSLEDTLSRLLERVRAELGVDTAAVLLLDEDRGVLVARAARGLEEEVREGVQVPLAGGSPGAWPPRSARS